MVRRCLAVAASACIFALLAACEHPNAPVPALAPSPDSRIMTAVADAVGAPIADVQRASSVLAALVAERERAQVNGGAAEERGRVVGLLIDAAAALGTTTTRANLPAVARNLDQVLRTTSPGKSIPRRLD